MDSSVFSLPTKSKNIYLLDMNNTCICHVHPELSKDIRSDYYQKKYNYLLEKGFFKDNQNNHQARIHPNFIKKQLANIKQIVFEITDACNLNCKYCSYGELYHGATYRLHRRRNVAIVRTPSSGYIMDAPLVITKFTNMNLYIFNERNRAAVYGIGTYICALTTALANSLINVCVVHLRSEKPQIPDDVDFGDDIVYYYLLFLKIPFYVFYCSSFQFGI